MLLSLPVKAKRVRALIESLRPDILVDGHEPEQRVVFSGISWGQYLAWDKALGDDRPGPRFYYLDGELEIMSTSEEHERIKTWLGDFMGDYLVEKQIEVDPVGQATMRLELERGGAEPDESWRLQEKGTFPDLVLEIALTSGGIPKLKLYERFGVAEVWFWRLGRLEVYALLADGSGYEQVANSRLLPDLDLALLERCAKIRNWQQARRAFRAGLSASR